MRLNELGEFGLIERVTRDLAAGAGVIRGVGDDAAVYEAAAGEWQLAATDTLVEDVHFARSYFTWRDLGYRALAVNLSDIAAMGGRPCHAVVGLCLPADTAVTDVQEFYAGLAGVARTHGVSLIGGDTVRGPVVVVNLTLLGAAAPGRVKYRSGARPGDLVMVTGTPGDAAAGLYLFQNPGDDRDPETTRRLKNAHVRPEPRVEAGRLLGASPAVTAMIDVSDGLSGDLAHICRCSAVGCVLQAERIPLSAALRKMAGCLGRDPLEWALHGGEDYELLFTVSPGYAGEIGAILERIGVPVAVIGEITALDEGTLLRRGGRTMLLEGRGFDHFTPGMQPRRDVGADGK